VCGMFQSIEVDHLKHHTDNKFCQKFGRSVMEILHMLWTVYNKQYLSGMTVKDCHELLEDGLHRRQPATSQKKDSVRQV